MSVRLVKCIRYEARRAAANYVDQCKCDSFIMTYFIHFADVAKTISGQHTRVGDAMNISLFFIRRCCFFVCSCCLLKTIRDDVPMVVAHRNSIGIGRVSFENKIPVHILCSYILFLLCIFGAVVVGVALETTVIFRNSDFFCCCRCLLKITFRKHLYIHIKRTTKLGSWYLLLAGVPLKWCFEVWVQYHFPCIDDSS